MKAAKILLSALILIVGVFALMPVRQPPDQILTGLVVALAAVSLALQLIEGPCSSAVSAKPDAVEAAKPVTAAPAPRAEAEVISLLAALQEKGRFVDFLMDNITAYDDRQVGAAARVVHQGCREVVDNHFSLEPVDTSGEGSTITVPENFAAGEYRLTGNLSGSAPFRGILTHQGWKTASVKLPRLLDESTEAGRLPVIAPAEVEVK